MTDTEKPVSSTEKERQEWLHRLWVAQIRKLIEKIENTSAEELEAATLTSARQFLSDNGVTTDSLKQHTDGSPIWAAATAAALYGQSADELDELNHDAPELPALDWPDGAIK